MRVAFSLGSNLGDSPALLGAGVNGLREWARIDDLRVSRVYRTAPWGVTDQPDFLNLVVVGESSMPPDELLAVAQGLEAEAGRVRPHVGAPRTLDIDLLAAGDLVIDDPDLVLPHPRAHLRGFVLVPWAEVDPDFVLVGHGRIADLAAVVDQSGVHLDGEA